MDLTKLIVMTAITLILGIVLLGVAATQVNEKTAKYTVSNETVDISSFRSGAAGAFPDPPNSSVSIANVYSGDDSWKDDYTDCQYTSSTVSMVLANTTAMTYGTDYNITTDGNIAIINNSNMQIGGINDTYISYSYCQDEYQVTAYGRSLLNTVVGLVALMVLAAAVAGFYLIYKEVR